MKLKPQCVETVGKKRCQLARAVWLGRHTPFCKYHHDNSGFPEEGYRDPEDKIDLRKYLRPLLKEQKFRCGICGYRIQKNHHDTSVDHIHPRSFGGLDDIDNLMAVHSRCNSAKADYLLHDPRIRENVANIPRHARNGESKVKLPIDGKELYERNKNGESTTALAIDKKVSVTTVQRSINEYRIKLGPKAEPVRHIKARNYSEARKQVWAKKNPGLVNLNPRELYERNRDGESQKTLAKEKGVDSKTILDRINEHRKTLGLKAESAEQIKSRNFRIAQKQAAVRKNPNLLNLDGKELYTRNRDGESLSTLAKEKGVSITPIMTIIKEYQETLGLEPQNKSKAMKQAAARKNPNLLTLNAEELYIRNKNGESQKALAKEKGVSRQAVINRIKEYKATL